MELARKNKMPISDEITNLLGFMRTPNPEEHATISNRSATALPPLVRRQLSQTPHRYITPRLKFTSAAILGWKTRRILVSIRPPHSRL
jgi:hypothetical protein